MNLTAIGSLVPKKIKSTTALILFLRLGWRLDTRVSDFIKKTESMAADDICTSLEAIADALHELRKSVESAYEPAATWPHWVALFILAMPYIMGLGAFIFLKLAPYL
jgi:hypothetical protein